MKVIKAIYNFIVGDMVILIGVLITVVLLWILSLIPQLGNFKILFGILLIVAVLCTLYTTLQRETGGK